MSRYPRAARDAKIKCMECNAPVTETVDGGYACVDCGRNPLAEESNSGGGSAMDATTVDETTVDERGSADGSPLDETGLEDDASLEDDSGTALGVGN